MPCEIVLKFCYLLFLVGLLLLQSCQPTREAASYNTQLGLAYLKQGDRPNAKRKLLLALSQAPHSPDANAAMAYFMEMSGEIDKARLFYEKAMTMAPGKGAQLNNYGAFLCRHGQYERAEQYFLRAANDINYEHTAGAYENAGLCAMAIPNYIKAKHYFAKALQHDPGCKQARNELVNIERIEHKLDKYRRKK